jgi:hypothetical protein
MRGAMAAGGPEPSGAQSVQIANPLLSGHRTFARTSYPPLTIDFRSICCAVSSICNRFAGGLRRV